MKKAAAGFLAGVLLTLSATAYADDIHAAMGKVVDGTYPLIIDGKRSERDVIVVDDTSYLPVRAAGEMFGYDVDFVSDQVLLDKKKSTAGSTSGTGSSTGSTSGAGTDADAQAPALPAGPVSVRTSLFTLGSNKGTLLERDGNIYLSALVFSNFLSASGNTASITLPGRAKVEFNYNGEYQEGVQGFNDSGGLYVLLSALGLKAVPNGKTGIQLVQN